MHSYVSTVCIDQIRLFADQATRQSTVRPADPTPRTCRKPPATGAAECNAMSGGATRCRYVSDSAEFVCSSAMRPRTCRHCGACGCRGDMPASGSRSTTASWAVCRALPAVPSAALP